MTMRGELVFVDTNVLLSATNSASGDHETARRLFPVARDAGCHLAVCGQVLREYAVVATRPVTGNGLGMEHDKALRNMEWFRNQMVFLEETEPVFDELHRLIGRHEYTGTRIHDANIAAVAIAHNARAIITANTNDFSAIDELGVLSPEQATRVFAHGR